MADPRKHEWDVCLRFMAGQSVAHLTRSFRCTRAQIEEILRGNTLELVKRDMFMREEGVPHV